jgi:hypothetical protein
MRERFERFAFERRQNQNGNLITGFRLMGFEVARERGGDSGRQHLCQVHDAPCELRNIERKGKRGQG